MRRQEWISTGVMAALGFAALALIGGGSPDGEAQDGSPGPPTRPTADTLLEVDSARVAGRLGGGEEWRTDFSRVTVPPEQIVSGGPPRDGIPSIDDPQFVDLKSADGWLEPREPVLTVREGEAVKAYPLRILIYHEIVNDRLGDRPVAGPLEGRSLEAVAHGDYFWFAWVAFRPQTRLWSPGQP